MEHVAHSQRSSAVAATEFWDESSSRAHCCPCWACARSSAQTPASAQSTKGTGVVGGANGTPVVGVSPPPDYVIGPDDVLTVVFWRDKDMSGDVTVRPDGKITLPLVNEVAAAGLTPEQLRAQLTELAGKLIEEPNITVVVKAINSRKVFVMGQVGKPGPYRLVDRTTVLQMLAIAGGVLEYAKVEGHQNHAY